MKTAAGTVDVVDLAGLRVLRLSHPGHGNSIDTATLVALIAALETAPRAGLPLVIEGEGGCFSAGYPLAEMRRFDGTTAVAYCRLAHQAVAAVERWPGVTIALVRGACLGPGLELALGCDLIAAAPGARFALPGLAFGLMPAAGGVRRLAARTSQAVVRDVFLIGRSLRAGEARQAGIVDRIVGTTTAAERVAQRWGRWNQASVAAIRSLRLAKQGHPEPVLEADLFAAGFASGDIQRRLAAG